MVQVEQCALECSLVLSHGIQCHAPVREGLVDFEMQIITDLPHFPRSDTCTVSATRVGKKVAGTYSNDPIAKSTRLSVPINSINHILYTRTCMCTCMPPGNVDIHVHDMHTMYTMHVPRPQFSRVWTNVHVLTKLHHSSARTYQH